MCIVQSEQVIKLWFWFFVLISSLIRQPCDFKRDFDFVLLQLADTLNTQFKYETEADIHYWSVRSVDVKVVQSLIPY